MYEEKITAKMRREGAIGREKWTTRADDVLYCIDMQTGQTRWTRRFAWQGVNIGAGFNKGGPNIPVIAHDTTIYCLGSAGNLYAVDALTGAVIWQNDNGRRAELQRRYVEANEASHVIKFRGFNRDWRASPGVAADEQGPVLAVRDVLRHNRPENGLMGFDGITGERLWLHHNI